MLPKTFPFLNNLVQREIVYRLLRGPQGARLRAIATLGDQSHRTAKAIAWLKANYAKPLHVGEMAEVARMGMSTLHHHFRALSAMSRFNIKTSFDWLQRENGSSRGLMPTAQRLKLDMKARVNSTGSTNASSVNHPCAISKRVNFRTPRHFAIDAIRGSFPILECDLAQAVP